MTPRSHSPRGDTGWANALIAVVASVLIVLLFVTGAIAFATCAGSSAAPAGDIYASLGDSIAAGNGASDARTSAWVPLVAAPEEGVTAFNVAVAGATTQDVIDEQLARVLSVSNSGRVRFVTISAGGNDLAGLIPNAACVEGPLPAACPLDDALAAVEANLDTIIGQLRDSNRRMPIVLLAYPNFFSGTGHPFEAPAERVLPRLNAVIEDVASRYDHVAVAHPWDAFEDNGDELTHVLDDRFDPHPNDAGHRAIAAAVSAALEEAR